MKLTDEQIDEAAKDWESGKATIRDIAARLHCRHATVSIAVMDKFGYQKYNRIKHEHLTGKSNWKPGDVVGAAKDRAVPIGTIRDRRGNKGHGRVRVIKFADVPGAGWRNWETLSRYRYRQRYGEIAKGVAILFRDGDPTNDDIDNLVAVPVRDTWKWYKEHKGFKSKWIAGVQKAVGDLPQKVIAERVRNMHRGLKQWRQDQKRLAREAEDQARLARIREIIPVPACVSERMESGWWDNRDEENNEDEWNMDLVDEEAA